MTHKFVLIEMNRGMEIGRRWMLIDKARTENERLRDAGEWVRWISEMVYELSQIKK